MLFFCKHLIKYSMFPEHYIQHIWSEKSAHSTQIDWNRCSKTSTKKISYQRWKKCEWNRMALKMQAKNSNHIHIANKWIDECKIKWRSFKMRTKYVLEFSHLESIEFKSASSLSLKNIIEKNIQRISKPIFCPEFGIGNWKIFFERFRWENQQKQRQKIIIVSMELSRYLVSVFAYAWAYFHEIVLL